MNITELVRTRPEHRRVGIQFEDRIHVMQHAKRLYIELGIATDIHDNTISLEVPRIAAPWFMGLLERATGHIGYNDWDRT